MTPEMQTVGEWADGSPAVCRRYRPGDYVRSGIYRDLRSGRLITLTTPGFLPPSPAGSPTRYVRIEIRAVLRMAGAVQAAETRPTDRETPIKTCLGNCESCRSRKAIVPPPPAG